MEKTPLKNPIDSIEDIAIHFFTLLSSRRSLKEI